MIENETQYHVTRDQLAKFMLSIKEHDAAVRPDDIHPRLWKAQRAAMQSMVDEFIEELNTYEGKF